jgi:hypothetical protein
MTTPSCHMIPIFGFVPPAFHTTELGDQGIPTCVGSNRHGWAARIVEMNNSRSRVDLAIGPIAPAILSWPTITDWKSACM